MNTIQINSNYILDVDSHQLINNKTNSQLKIEPMLVEILNYLVSNRQRLISRQELIDRFWGEKLNSDESLNQAIAKIRRALHDAGLSKRAILTIPKKGFKWNDQAGRKNQHPFIIWSQRDNNSLYLVGFVLLIYVVFRIYFHPH